jgi:hypothetical protein
MITTDCACFIAVASIGALISAPLTAGLVVGYLTALALARHRQPSPRPQSQEPPSGAVSFWGRMIGIGHNLTFPEA